MQVKITDNALARDLFPMDYHCLGDNENRPVRWMALESLLNNDFSSASDVVSTAAPHTHFKKKRKKKDQTKFKEHDTEKVMRESAALPSKAILRRLVKVSRRKEVAVWVFFLSCLRIAVETVRKEQLLGGTAQTLGRRAPPHSSYGHTASWQPPLPFPPLLFTWLYHPAKH